MGTLKTVVDHLEKRRRKRLSDLKMINADTNLVDHIKNGCFGPTAEAAITRLHEIIAQRCPKPHRSRYEYVKAIAKKCPKCQEDRQERKTRYDSGSDQRQLECAQASDRMQGASGGAENRFLESLTPERRAKLKETKSKQTIHATFVEKTPQKHWDPPKSETAFWVNAQ